MGALAGTPHSGVLKVINFLYVPILRIAKSNKYAEIFKRVALVT